MKKFWLGMKSFIKMILFVIIVILAIPVFILAIFSLMLVQVINVLFKWVTNTNSNLLNFRW